MSLYHEVRRIWCVNPQLTKEELPDKVCLAMVNSNDLVVPVVISFGLSRSGNKYYPASEMNFNLDNNIEWNAMMVYTEEKVLATWEAGSRLGCEGSIVELEFEPASKTPANFSFSVGNLVPM